MFLWFPVLDLARAPRRTARKKGSGYENVCCLATLGSNNVLWSLIMRESNRNLDIPPPGIPGEFACLVFEEGGNLTFFLVEGGEFAYGVGNLNFSFKHMC